VIVLDQLMDFMPKIQVAGADETRVLHGNSILLPPGAEHRAQLARILNKEGQFIAIAAIERGWVHPRLVLTSINSD
jgi:hypothetical protein